MAHFSIEDGKVKRSMEYLCDEFRVLQNGMDEDILGNAQIVLAAYESGYYEYLVWDASSGDSAFYYGCFLFEHHFKPDVRIIDVSNRQEGTIVVTLTPGLGAMHEFRQILMKICVNAVIWVADHYSAPDPPPVPKILFEPLLPISTTFQQEPSKFITLRPIWGRK